jgi:hypothetical protein
MGDKQHVVTALQDYFGSTFSQKRVSTSVLQSEEQCKALADVVLARVGSPLANVEFDYWMEHTMINGEVYRSTNLSQANISTPVGRTGSPRVQRMPLDMFEAVMLEQIRAKKDVVSIQLVRAPVIDRPLREVVRTYSA